VALRFFADHCVSKDIIAALEKMGHEVLRLKDLIPPDSSDATVVAKAQDVDSILLSLNGDFADIVTYPPSNYHGIVALQLRNHPETIPQILERLGAYLSAHPARDHYKGKLFLVEIHRIRVRE
jgi:predicted nuclease of predicted toxin-antitoxin system